MNTLSKKVISGLEYIFFILLILSLRTIFVHLMYYRTNIYLKVLMIIVSTLLILLGLSKFRVEKHFVFSMFSYILVAMMFFLINFSRISEGLQALFFDLFLLLPVFVILIKNYSNQGRLGAFIAKYSEIVTVIALISLFFWIFGSLLYIISPNIRVLTNWADIRGRIISGYYYLYFETQRIELLGFSGWRNTSIFVEGPMYNFVLNIAYIQSVFFEKNRKKFREIILLFSILSTFSITGILVISLINFYNIYLKSKLTTKKVLFLATLSPLALFGAIRLIYDIILEKAQSSSASIRMDDLLAGAKAWWASPLLGHGYMHLEAVLPYMNMSIRPNTGYSNGIFSTFVQGGVILFLMYYLPMVLIFFSRKISFDLKFSILLWIFLLLSTIVDNTPLFLFVIALGYVICFSDEYTRGTL
ncbi:TPA: O-antigen ligase family protein [Streptococcus suis]